MTQKLHCTLCSKHAILPSVPSIHIIFASTSGHTEYVVQVLQQEIQEARITAVAAELATKEDFEKGDFLVLASGTWNTGGQEGQLNPHMHLLLKKKFADHDLAGRKVAMIGLGDERYRYRARAIDHIKKFIEGHNGEVFGTPLVVINEPYGQEEQVIKWWQTLARKFNES